ncbi:MAG: helix-turn-helix domain-containing protein [Hylemonella sp.]
MRATFSLAQLLDEFNSRQAKPPARRMHHVLNDVLDGAFTHAVYTHTPVLRQLIDGETQGLRPAYAEFRLTNLNPLTSVHRPGLEQDFHEPLAQRHLDSAKMSVADTLSQHATNGLPNSSAHLPSRPEASGLSSSSATHASRRKLQRLSEVAHFYGLERSATFSLLRLFEQNGHQTSTQAAQHLNLTSRTLERHLHDEGTSLEMLRSAVRLLRANARLRAQERLSAIATDENFSDQSHMNRAFMAACGMTPRELQLLYKGKSKTLS